MSDDDDKNASELSSKDESATNQGAKCRRCHKTVSVASQYSHVMTAHIPQKKVLCGYCSHGDKYNIGNVKTHLRNSHPGQKVKIIDKRPKFYEKAREEIRICFPSYSSGDRRSTRGSQWRNKAAEKEETSELSDSDSAEELSDQEDDIPAHKKVFDDRCNLCYTICAGLLKRRKHVARYHVEIKKFGCPLCHRGAKTRQYVKRHIKLKHPGAEGDVLKNTAELLVAVSEAMTKCFPPRGQPTTVDSHRDKLVGHQMQCAKCPKVLKNQGSIKSHVLSLHVPGIKVRCPYCAFGDSYNAQQVKMHVKKKHEGKEIRVVNKLIEFREDYYRIRKECFPALTYNRRRLLGKPNGSMARKFVQCKECKMSFQNSGPSRERHIFRHHIKQLPYSCPYCPNFGHYTKFHVNAHIMSQHATEKVECTDRRPQFEPQLTDLIGELLVPALQPPPMRVRGQARPGPTTKPFCKVCQMHICGTTLNHIQLYHLEVETVKCGHCGKGDRGRMDNIKIHCAQRHRDLPLKIHDNRLWFQPLVKLHYYKCFGGNGIEGATTAELELD